MPVPQQSHRPDKRKLKYRRRQRARLLPNNLPEVSPGLELSGYGTFTGVDSSDFINWVTVTISQFQSDARMQAPRVELWDFAGTPALIGSALGTRSVASTNIDSLIFSNVTFGQLGTLRVRVYANQGTAPKGAIQNVNYAGLTVNFSPVLGQATLATGVGAAKNATVAAVDGRNPGRRDIRTGGSGSPTMATFT